VKLLIKNGRVIDPASGTDETLDILIDKKKIAEIKTSINSPDAKVIDASRLVVAPGFIDMHVHLREPGQEYKETIRSGSLAAAKGGFTSIACMPNTEPINDRQEITTYIVAQAAREAVVNVFPIAAVTLGQKGNDLTEMSDLIKAGAVAFSDDGRSVASGQLMRRALEYVKQFDGLIIDHCEDPSLSAQGVAHEGTYSYRLGLKGIPAAAEETMVARDIILAEKVNARVHLAHMSTAGSVDLIRTAKNRKLKITSEVTPHHLVLDDSYLENYDPNLKVNPPIRGKKDVSALVKAIKDGIIEVFATDHAPHSVDDKTVEFDFAPFGIIGLETAVSLILDKLVKKEHISIHRAIEMFATNPANILQLNQKGKIAPGMDADLTILNLQKTVTVAANKFKSKSKNSPFNGWKLTGAPVFTIVGGKVVFSD